MKRALFYILSLMLTVSAVAAGQRDLQYLPEGRGFVRENGWNRYSRALYGSYANWRLETSDRPLFATYDKGKAWNIQLHIQVGDCLYALDSTSYCHAYYEGGKREYVVSDEAWLGGELLVKAIAEHEGNNALWQFEAKGFPKRVLGKKKTLKLIALRRPIAKMKMSGNKFDMVGMRQYPNYNNSQNTIQLNEKNNYCIISHTCRCVNNSWTDIRADCAC